jgi:putative hydrolase
LIPEPFAGYDNRMGIFKRLGKKPIKIAVDVHTHSISSGHAYSTLEEMARAAGRRRLEGFVLTDHGPGIENGTHPYHFGNLRILPERVSGVRIYRGVEANIMAADGALDLDPGILARLDFVLAGFHEICLESGTSAQNTDTLIAVLANPLVDAVSHPGNPAYPVDFRAIALAAKEHGKALEINDSSFRVRKGSDASCPVLARACLETGTRIVCGSDAHWSGDVGRFDRVLGILEEIDFPRERIINLSTESFETYIEERRTRIAAAS